MGRIHFSHQDVLRIRFALRPAPFVDLWMALATIQRPTDDPLYARRRRELRSRVTRAALPLFDLVAPNGAMPDFLVPLTDDLEAGLDAIRSTPRSVVRSQLNKAFALRRSCPAWIKDLASGQPRTWDALVQALRETHGCLVQATWPRLRDGFHGDLARRADLLMTHGAEAVLESIPHSRWTGTTLENDDGRVPRLDLHLHGEGLTLVPSANWSGAPLLGVASDGSHILIHATLATSSARHPDPCDDPLAALLGSTRAAVLRLLSQPHTTTQVARELGISLASASEHAKVLRTAGLVTSHRHGSAVRHFRTALGHRLVCE